MSSAIADADATQTGDESGTAQDQPTAGTPDGAKPEAGQDQPKAETGTLLTSEKAPARPVVPDSYALTLPENTPLDPSVTERVTALAKVLGLTDATHAQGVLDAIHGEVATSVETFKQAIAPDGTLWAETKQRLEADALADKEIGGSVEALSASVGEAKRVLDQYATPEFKSFLEQSGDGSHPEFIRFLKRVAKATGEDRLVQGEPPTPAPKSRAGRLYQNLPDTGL